jgi:hypothetical protein
VLSTLSKEDDMKRLFPVWIIILLAGCAQKPSVLTLSPEGMWLGLKFVPGRSTTYKQTAKISTSVQTGETTQKINTSIEIRMTETVKDTGDVTVVEVRFDDVTGTLRFGSQLKSIDEMEGLQGTTTSLKLSRDGRIIELKGLEDVEYFKKSGEQPEQQFEENYGFLPNKIMKPGESWSKKFEGIKATYTFERIEKKGKVKCARIAVIQEISTSRTGTEKGMSTKLKIKGTGTGTIWFDIKEGRVLESKIRLSLEGEQQVHGGRRQKSMNVPIRVDQESHRKIVK